MSDASGFGKFVPGFEFLQSLAGQAASGVAQGLGQSVPQMPNLSSWVAPTFNVEELDKRIDELKAVHFWLDQNTKALAATIQALEVQKMTLATLKSMNFSLGDVANALKIKAADTMASFGVQAPAPAAPPHTQFAGLEVPPRTYGNPGAQPPAEPEAAEEPEAAPAPETPIPPPAAAGGVVDPMHWWGALSQQFQTIATNALKDVAQQSALDATHQAASSLTEQAVKTATGVAGKAADTLARNVGAAVGMGQAAARVVKQGAGKAAAAGQRVAPRKAAPPVAPPPVAKGRAPKAAPQAAAQVTPKAGPKAVPAAAPAPASARVPGLPSLSAGDWPLPTAFFPGFQGAAAPQPAAPTQAARQPARPAAKKVAKKAAKKAAPRR